MQRLIETLLNKLPSLADWIHYIPFILVARGCNGEHGKERLTIQLNTARLVEIAIGGAVSALLTVFILTAVVKRENEYQGEAIKLNATQIDCILKSIKELGTTVAIINERQQARIRREEEQGYTVRPKGAKR